MTDEQFQAMLDVHLVAPFRILRAAAEPIRIFAKKEAEAGREVFRKVVNISSIAGLYGNAGQASYSSAKASLVGLTRTMCKEWGRYKVNVNCVAFGLINTRLTQPIEARQKTIDVAGRDIKVGVQPQMLEAMARMIPLGRGGTPEEAAGAVYLFCSPNRTTSAARFSSAAVASSFDDRPRKPEPFVLDDDLDRKPFGALFRWQPDPDGKPTKRRTL